MGQRKLSRALETWDGGGSCQRLLSVLQGRHASEAMQRRKKGTPSHHFQKLPVLSLCMEG